MPIIKRAAAGVAGIIVVLSVFTVTTAAKGPATGPPEGAVQDHPRGKSRDVSKPGEKQTMQVWRNGKFHTVKISVSRRHFPEAEGQPEEIVTHTSEVEVQLPPVDPALVDVKPTKEQEDAAWATVGGYPGGDNANSPARPGTKRP